MDSPVVTTEYGPAVSQEEAIFHLTLKGLACPRKICYSCHNPDPHRL